MAQVKNQVSKNKATIFVISLIIIVFVVPIFLSYSNYYPSFLDKKVIYALDSLVADLPLLPKTPKQVITKSLIQNQSLKDYSLVTNLTLETKKVKIVDLKLNQAIENAGEQDSQSKSIISGTSILLPTESVNIETTKLQNKLIFKIASLPSELGLNVDSLKGQWYQIDLSEFQKELSVKARSDAQIIGDVRGSFEKIESNLVDNSFFSKVKSFKKTTVSGQEFYEIKLALDSDNLKNLPFLNKNFLIKSPELVLLVSTKNYYLSRLDLSGTLDSANSTNKLISNLQIHLTAELSQINKSQNISLPTNLEIIKTPLDLSLKVKSPTQPDLNSLFAATKDSRDLGENFLTLERLLSVILLLPKSI